VPKTTGILFDDFGDDWSQRSHRNDDIDFSVKQFGDEFRNMVPLSLDIALVDQKVLPFGIAKITQSLTKSLELR
jgi:hypothetical protein